MAGFGSSSGNKREPIALITGIFGLIIGVIFFLQKFGIIMLSMEIADTTFMYIFAGFTVFSSLILLLTTLGVMG